MYPLTTPQVSGSLSRRLLTLLVLTLPLATGCANMNNTQSDALGGGLIGGALGAIVGGPRHALEGAAIGGALGAGTGAVIGHSEDKAEQRYEQRVAVAQAQAQARMLGLTDVAQMARDRQSDDVIIGQIRATGSVFRLSATDLTWLKENGVSDRVINEMQYTAMQPRRIYTSEPVYVGPPPVVYVEPAPPPVAVGVGIGFRR
jgi:hypothetical protein